MIENYLADDQAWPEEEPSDVLPFTDEQIEAAENLEAHQRKPWAIEDDVDAERVMNKIKAIRAKAMEMDDFYQAKREEAQKRFQAEEEHWEFLLHQYFGTVPHKKIRNGEAYDLPSGRLSYKSGAVTYTQDKDKLLQWAKQSMPEAVQTVTTEKALWADIKRKCKPGTNVIAATGEVVDGITVGQSGDEFEVIFK